MTPPPVPARRVTGFVADADLEPSSYAGETIHAASPAGLSATLCEHGAARSGRAPPTLPRTLHVAHGPALARVTCPDCLEWMHA